uniref:Uncharacterized protein n=1 Tax=Romanomermis culicivorax TaxID=13658 RepID=A0A915L5T4_ROMCU
MCISLVVNYFLIIAKREVRSRNDTYITSRYVLSQSRRKMNIFLLEILSTFIATIYFDVSQVGLPKIKLEWRLGLFFFVFSFLSILICDQGTAR